MTCRALSPACTVLLISLLLSVGALPVFAEVGLSQLLRDSESELQWDSSLELGSIRNGPNVVSFKPGLEWVLLNSSELLVTGPISRGGDGGIRFTEQGAAAVESALRRPVGGTASLRAGRPRIAGIIIDAGHGGKDPGTSHVHIIDGKKINIVEKDIVLEVAREFYGKLRAKYPDRTILMTRTDDTYPTLEQRTDLANSIPLKENEAMIFISIHVNASFNPKAGGFEVWYLPQDYRRDVIDPNALDAGNQKLYPILNSMREEEYTVESVLLGRKILSGVSTAVGAKVPDRGLKAESWFVVRNAKMPAVLVELGFVTNEKEARLLSTPSYLKKLSQGIYNGVADFINYFDHLSGFME